jgi:hypothetical protein
MLRGGRSGAALRRKRGPCALARRSGLPDSHAPTDAPFRTTLAPGKAGCGAARGTAFPPPYVGRYRQVEIE